MSAFDPNARAAAGTGIFGLPSTVDESAVVIVPVPFAATVSYGGGAERGPAAIREASMQVDLYDHQFGRVYERGIHMLEPDPAIAAAHERARPAVEGILAADDGEPATESIAAVDAAGALVNASVRDAVSGILAAGKVPGVLGGDHSVPFGAIQAVAERYPELGILHLDAHADLRVAYEGFRWSHASIMDNVCREVRGVKRIVQIGIRDFCEQELDAIHGSRGRIVCHFDHEWRRRMFGGETYASLAEEAVGALPETVYVSFDIDGLDPSLCPNTGTPVPSGLAFAEAAFLIEAVVRSGRRIVGFDLVEVAPAPGGADEWDANVGARMLYKLCGAASHGVRP